MTDRDDDFERKLEHSLREWTDPAARRLDWSEAARALIAASARPPGFLRPRLVALTAAATVLAALAVVVLLDLPPFNGEPTGTATSQPSFTAAPTALPGPSTLPGSQLDLSALAWWDEQSFGFGYVEDPGPSSPATPPSYRQVRIGTLDGRITAVMALSDEWSHSYVSGPVGTDVLVVNDDGSTSIIWLVSALDGSRTVLKEDPDIISAAALSPTGDETYYVKVDRRTGIDRGLWRRSNTGLAMDMPMLPGPLGEPLGEVIVWQLLTSRDGQTIVVQSCFGEVRCTSYFVDLATGTARQIDSISWPRGITDDELITRRADPGESGLVAVNLATLELREVLPDAPEAMPVHVGDRWLLAFSAGGFGPGGEGPTALLGLDDNKQGPVPGDGEDAARSELHSLGERHGVVLPDGWVIRWPGPEGYRGPNPAEFAPGQLINVATGERLTLDPFTWVIANDSCVDIAPAELPDGRAVEVGIETLDAGLLYSQWGAGDAAIVEAIGYSVSGRAGPGVTIRGLPGNVVEIGDTGVGRIALVWEELGCPYTVWLPLGSTGDEAREYASRF